MQAILDQACAAFPDHEPLHAERAASLAHMRRWDEALLVSSRWHDSLWSARLRLRRQWLARSGEPSEAEAVVEQADPADPILFEVRAARLQRDPEALEALCDAVLAVDPAALHVLYPKAVALAALGRTAEAFETLALNRFVHSVLLDRFDESFLEAVAAEVRGNPTLQADPSGHATVNGLRTQVFPAATDAAAPLVLDAIQEEADRYARSLAGDHPFVRARPEQVVFNPWALLFSQDSYQSVHIHPASWLTGVFYVRAPEGKPRPGRIRLGGFPPWAEAPAPWPLVEYEPEPGKLLLFPSFIPHETVPTGSGSERISIAFDIRKAS